jgi:hypothetical protein
MPYDEAAVVNLICPAFAVEIVGYLPARVTVTLFPSPKRPSFSRMCDRLTSWA